VLIIVRLASKVVYIYTRLKEKQGNLHKPGVGEAKIDW